MDEIARYNRERWDDLAKANVMFSVPFLELTGADARRLVDRQGLLGDVEGKDVLCLASGGGQQSAAFALLGARVTVLDLSTAQLERDREAAAHYGVDVATVQGDMRNLSAFAADAFHVVWHAFSVSFVPEVKPVLAEVARVLRPGGLYRIEWANPFVAGVDESHWTGDGYLLKWPYVDGAEIPFDDPDWEVEQGEGDSIRLPGPREFRHGLGTVVNTLIGLGFLVQGIWEELTEEPDAPPGTWEHLKSFAPPWLTIWAWYRPDVPSLSGSGEHLR